MMNFIYSKKLLFRIILFLFLLFIVIFNAKLYASPKQNQVEKLIRKLETGNQPLAYYKQVAFDLVKIGKPAVPHLISVLESKELKGTCPICKPEDQLPPFIRLTYSDIFRS